MSPELGKASGRCLRQGTGSSAAVPWWIVELNCSRHYTVIVYESTKLLLIGIIKNYNRGSFILAVISFAAASINIVSGGLPIRMEESSRLSERSRNVETITAPDHGLVVTGARSSE
jgi:hypothetical protein